jgi:hypothetical protein
MTLIYEADEVEGRAVAYSNLASSLNRSSFCGTIQISPTSLALAVA